MKNWPGAGSNRANPRGSRWRAEEPREQNISRSVRPPKSALPVHKIFYVSYPPILVLTPTFGNVGFPALLKDKRTPLLHREITAHDPYAI
jgi:hypothetical protein